MYKNCEAETYDIVFLQKSYKKSHFWVDFLESLAYNMEACAKRRESNAEYCFGGTGNSSELR